MSLKRCKRLYMNGLMAVAALVAFAFVTPPQLIAQIHGVAASVTSQNFGGHINHAPGVPASITSTGSFAPRMHRGGEFLPRAGCCINPLIPSRPRRFEHRRHEFHNRRAVVVPYYVPYYYDYDNSYYTDQEEQPEQAQEPPDQYNGGPTIFDRRGPGGSQFAQPPASTGPQQQAAAPAPTAAPEQPEETEPELQTILVFKDGHQLEIANYAIVGDMLIDLTPGHHRKIALADLDLQATAKQNDDRGVDFTLPSSPRG